MSLQSAKKTTILGQMVIILFAKRIILPCVCVIGLVSAAGARTFTDPDPEVSSTEFGHAIVVIGDVTGDGIPDLAVAAPFQDGDFTSTAMGYGDPQNVGKIYLVDGATFNVFNQLTDPEFDLIQPQHFGGQLGGSLAVIADINGDGIKDIIGGVPHHIGDPNTMEALILGGKVLVFSGKTGALLFDLQDPTETEGGRFGYAVAGLGDINGDGFADMLVGAPGRDIPDEDGVRHVGLCYIFSGKTGQAIRTVNHPDFGGAEAGALFGSSVANAGDVDGDGVTDMIIGAPGEGHVFVFSGASGTQIYDMISPVADPIPSFGFAVDGGKDFDGDGKPDFVIGAPLSKNMRGAAYTFNGNTGQLLRTLKPSVVQNFARFGASVFASDDITGDRRADILVGAPDQNVNGVTHAGEVFVINGGNAKVFQSLISASPQSGARYGLAVSSADFDGDGKNTAIVGVPDKSLRLDDGTGTIVTHVQIGQVEIQ